MMEEPTQQQAEEWMAHMGQVFRQKLRETAIECGATSEEDIARLTRWEVYVDGEKFTGDAYNKTGDGEL